jgi:uncharacterized lipoprotein YddW (UPF0748 family)
MKRRTFIKGIGTLGLGFATLSYFNVACNWLHVENKTWKKWIWLIPEKGLPIDAWKKRFNELKQIGIDAILVQVYNSHKAWYKTPHLPLEEDLLEKLIKIGKSIGLEVHAWIWTMPNNNPYYVENHADFFAVNGLNQPSNSYPAYVGYYKFMCPNNLAVREFIKNNISFLATMDGLDGIHLDYIRFPDVIIAENLQTVYGVNQDREYPQFDYCYCKVCRNKFKSETGIDPLKDLADPSANDSWRQFRYDSITSLVNNELVSVANMQGKKITAAVFPNWENVRQQWFKWNLDGFFPMLYHNFYNQSIEWIGENIKMQIAGLENPKPIYSGLYLPSLKPDELKRAIEISYNANASGVAFFSYAQFTDYLSCKLLKSGISI